MTKRLIKLRHCIGCGVRRLPALIAGASLVVPAVTLLSTHAHVDAAVPGHNGLIALSTDVDRGVWTMRADGSELQRLTVGDQPSWSPDGARIVFRDVGIWVVDADGSGRTQLSAGSSSFPTWSPDGSRIAFAKYVERDHGAGDYDIWVMNADGSNPLSLDDAPGSWETHPTWSPDGSKIAFVSDRFDDGDIFVMGATGSNVTQLTSHVAADDAPDWSPDGTSILFSRPCWPGSAGSACGFYTVSPSGGGESLLTEFVNPGDAAWAPDGTQIVLSGGYSQEVYRVRSDGAGDPIELTAFNLSDSKLVDWQRVAESPSPYGEFTPLTPARVLDTRTGNGRGGVVGPLGQAQAFDVQITGRGGVAATGVSAVVMNVTVTQPTRASHLIVWPTGVSRPDTSNLNYVAGQTVPNLVTVAIGDSGRVSVFNQFGSTHVIMDVVGFYADDTGPAGSRFHSLAPERIIDTRHDIGGVGTSPIGTAPLEFDVLGRAGVPGSGVTAVVMNVTVALATQPSHLTVYPGDVGLPNASNLNYVANLTVPNLVVVRVPANGVIRFHNAFGRVHVIADVVGYYDGDTFTEAGRFIAFDPFRFYDSRDHDEPWGPGETWLVGQFPGFAGIPLGEADSVLLNVTAAGPSEASHLTVFPSDNCSVPNASNLNFTAGRNVPNQVIVRLGPTDGCARPDDIETIAIYNHAGRVHVIVDLFGMFTSPTTTLF